MHGTQTAPGQWVALEIMQCCVTTVLNEICAIIRSHEHEWFEAHNLRAVIPVLTGVSSNGTTKTNNNAGGLYSPFSSHACGTKMITTGWSSFYPRGRSSLWLWRFQRRAFCIKSFVSLPEQSGAYCVSATTRLSSLGTASADCLRNIQLRPWGHREREVKTVWLKRD